MHYPASAVCAASSDLCRWRVSAWRHFRRPIRVVVKSPVESGQSGVTKHAHQLVCVSSLILQTSGRHVPLRGIVKYDPLRSLRRPGSIIVIPGALLVAGFCEVKTEHRFVAKVVVAANKDPLARRVFDHVAHGSRVTAAT